MNTPWVESPFFEDILKTKNLTIAQKELATKYHKNGYLVVSNLFSEHLINKVQQETENKAFNENYAIKIPRDKTRIQDFWKVSESCRNLATNKSVLDILKLLYDREAIPFQTLNFNVGTQQRAHSDTIHFSSLPARYMCGVWVALEDITPKNGPLFYYPGSQRLPEYDFSHILKGLETPSYEKYSKYEDFIEKIMAKHGYEKHYFYAKKGDILIWSSNIIHGGAPVLKKNTTRWSQVTHYFFKDCIYYTPMLSNMVTNELYLREHLVDIKTGKKVKQSYNGKKIKSIRIDNQKSVLNNNLKNVYSHKLKIYYNKLVSKIKRVLEK